jgi:hypothetical protein
VKLPGEALAGALPAKKGLGGIFCSLRHGWLGATHRMKSTRRVSIIGHMRRFSD